MQRLLVWRRCLVPTDGTWQSFKTSRKKQSSSGCWALKKPQHQHSQQQLRVVSTACSQVLMKWQQGRAFCARMSSSGC